MLSKKIISFGNAIEPKEKQIIAFGGNFLGNRTVKVIASGVIAAIFIVLGMISAITICPRLGIIF